MAGLAVSELEKRNNALLVWNKINKKDGKDNSFELNDGKEVNLKFNPDVKDIGKYFKVEDIEEIKDLSKPKSTKMFFVDTKGNEYKLTDLKKTEEFGGGGGSGGGADDTAVTESMQCYYSALRYKLGTDLNSKNATAAKLKDKSLQKATAKGNVIIENKQKGKKSKADKGIYNSLDEIIRLSGNVTIINHNSIINGSKGITNLKTGKSNIIGDPKKKQRVKGVFSPVKKLNEEGKIE